MAHNPKYRVWLREACRYSKEHARDSNLWLEAGATSSSYRRDSRIEFRVTADGGVHITLLNSNDDARLFDEIREACNTHAERGSLQVDTPIGARWTIEFKVR